MQLDCTLEMQLETCFILAQYAVQLMQVEAVKK